MVRGGAGVHGISRMVDTVTDSEAGCRILDSASLLKLPYASDRIRHRYMCGRAQNNVAYLIKS